jgi:hypothetical protein
MALGEQDTAIWIGNDVLKPVGSSGKVRQVNGNRVLVNWGSGNETWCKVGSEVVTPRQAGNRGIEPWAKAFGT